MLTETLGFLYTVSLPSAIRFRGRARVQRQPDSRACFSPPGRSGRPLFTTGAFPAASAPGLPPCPRAWLCPFRTTSGCFCQQRDGYLAFLQGASRVGGGAWPLLRPDSTCFGTTSPMPSGWSGSQPLSPSNPHPCWYSSSGASLLDSNPCSAPYQLCDLGHIT